MILTSNLWITRTTAGPPGTRGAPPNPPNLPNPAGGRPRG
ncbi:hypothetical protein GA0115240_13783 [Streptomyces sp. DvalAA-14]|nr:hypothetical protein GA0115240_13783 [Streptomyces sp. DvalAA-14]